MLFAYEKICQTHFDAQHTEVAQVVATTEQTPCSDRSAGFFRWNRTAARLPHRLKSNVLINRQITMSIRAR